MKTAQRSMHVYISVALLIFGAVNISFAQENNKLKDTTFISKNISDNLLELKLAQLSEQKASDPQIKKIARQMAADHTEFLNSLKKIATKKNLTEPNENSTSVPNNLESASGRDFEKLWLNQMLSMHQAKITELENAVGSITDGELRAVVSQALPKIRMHFDMLTRMKYKYDE